MIISGDSKGGGEEGGGEGEGLSPPLIVVIALIGLFVIIIIVLTVAIAIMCRRRTVQRVDFGSKGWTKNNLLVSVSAAVSAQTGARTDSIVCVHCLAAENQDT